MEFFRQKQNYPRWKDENTGMKNNGNGKYLGNSK